MGPLHRSKIPALALAGLVLLPPLAALAAGSEEAPAPPATPPASEAPPQPPAATRKLEKGSFFRLLGQDVKGPSDMVVAQLVNVLVDAEAQPVGAVLDYGGFLGVGKRRLAVAWEVLSIGPSGIKLNLSREQLRSVPDFKDGEGAVLAVPPAPAEEPAPAGDPPAVQ
ncbi:hypothetical protein [Pseudoroseomonas ludipueritiae]|uniref:PRC-barrel domain-containing protein n=1 Tax=Pseudoroseomonas ludipueritiae TaxID=198093 RepID=A0ABR7R474_9PROT|nr:hypothetical protein [Pseudoroseomonas ludipueritiae]MBC9176430.1 hypothetical protein [Pseudoroseomonas ludipueritiae]